MSEDFSLNDYVMKPEKAGRPELIMFYGPYGSGKTWLAASASEVEGLYPILIIDNEGSTTGTITEFDQDRIDVIRPKERWPGKEYRAVRKILRDLIANDGGKYKTVIIDTMNTVFSWAKREGDKPGDGFAKWNFVHDELTEDGALIDQLRNAPFLVIMNLHEKKEGGEDEGPIFADFRWQGQGQSFLGQYPDTIGYLTRDTNAAGVTTSTLHTQPSKRNNAKNRWGLPAKMVDPSMKKMYEIIESKEGK